MRNGAVFIYNKIMSDQIQIVLCSDSHRTVEPLLYLRKKYAHADYFVHCGDSELPKEMLEGFACVGGNNDMYGEYPDHLALSIGSHRIYVTHGHRDMILGHLELLVKKAKNNQCDIVCYGHSHVADVEVIDGITCLNPGSIWHNRDGSMPSYMVVTLEDNSITWEKKVYKK